VPKADIFSSNEVFQLHAFLMSSMTRIGLSRN